MIISKGKLLKESTNERCKKIFIVPGMTHKEKDPDRKLQNELKQKRKKNKERTRLNEGRQYCIVHISGRKHYGIAVEQLKGPLIIVWYNVKVDNIRRKIRIWTMDNNAEKEAYLKDTLRFSKQSMKDDIEKTI